MRSCWSLLTLLLVLAAPAGAQLRASPSFSERAARSTQPDSTGYSSAHGWFGRDKMLHFGISAAGAGAMYALGREVGLGRWSSIAASAVAMGVIGVLREVGNADRNNLLTRDHVSRRDLVWDAAGIAVGISVADLLYRR